jgi:hypothetical protein
MISQPARNRSRSADDNIAAEPGESRAKLRIRDLGKLLVEGVCLAGTE